MRVFTKCGKKMLNIQSLKANRRRLYLANTHIIMKALTVYKMYTTYTTLLLPMCSIYALYIDNGRSIHF